jgi:hypothetical protein
MLVCIALLVSAVMEYPCAASTTKRRVNDGASSLPSINTAKLSIQCFTVAASAMDQPFRPPIRLQFSPASSHGQLAVDYSQSDHSRQVINAPAVEQARYSLCAGSGICMRIKDKARLTP